jgi:hypothetical protein
MKKASVALLTLVLIILTIWGCPIRPLIPPRKTPTPEVQMHSLKARDLIRYLKGMAPLVGPGPWYFILVA